MRIIAILSIYLSTITLSYGYDFNHLNLKGDLKNLVSGQKSFNSNDLRSRINSKILGKNGQKLVNLSNNDRYSDIFDKIMKVIGNDYQRIGENQAGPLILNHDLGGGVSNFSGFTWQKPFANFKLYANRELAPELFADNWIVHDSLTIVISASTLLSNMRDVDLIDIDDDGITAFAGIAFARTYHYYHFAETYLKGLSSDFSKLFLSFTKFNRRSALSLPPYNIIKKQDTFLFNAGGFVNVPVWNGIGVRGGVLVGKSYENTVTIQSVGADDSPKKDEFLRVSIDSKNQTAADAHLSLQLDFFNLLKLTILSYDLAYSIEKSAKVYLSFYENDRQDLNGDLSRRFRKLLKGRTKSIDYFRKNIVQSDERFKQNLDSKLYFLLLGVINKTGTEQIRIIKDGIAKTFYKHYSESKKIVQNFWSKILGIVVQKIFKFNTSVRNAAENSKQMTIEYEFEADQQKGTVSSEEKFSVKLTQSFFAKKTHGFWKRYYRKKAVTHLSRFTSLDMRIAQFVADSKLRGPLSVTTNVMIEKSGLSFFNNLTKKDAFNAFKKICKRKICVKNLHRRYLKYKNKLTETGVIDLVKFKKFLGKYYKSIRSNQDLSLVFGRDNVFINGNITAVTKKGAAFQSFFKTGQFKGLGVIDDFMRSTQDQVGLPIETY